MTRTPRRLAPYLIATALAGAVTAGAVTAGASTAPEPSPPGTETAGSDAAAGAPTSAEDGAFPVTIPTAFGDVTLDEEPQRVVAVGWSDAETALALGVQPVGVSDWLGLGGDGLGPWAADLYEEEPEQLGTMDLNLELLAALEPDLILDTRSDGTPERHDALSEIAPTLSPPADVVAYGTTWQQQLEMVAAALGRPAYGAELAASVDDAFAAAAAEHPEFDGAEAVVGAFSADGFGIYVTGDARVEFLSQLGFVQKPGIDELGTGNFYVPVGDENLELFDADVTVVFPIFVEASEFTENPVWQAVPSVADGRAVVIEDLDLLNAFSSGSVLGTLYAIDAITPLLADALA